MRRPLLVIFVMFLSVLPVFVVRANVPSVLSVTRRTESGNLIVDVKVNHSQPSETHYISVINLDVDGTMRSFTELPKATLVEATYSLNLGQTSPKAIKAQATCNIHGPGTYLDEASVGNTTPGGIPGYPTEATIFGIVIALCSAFIRSKKSA